MLGWMELSLLRSLQALLATPAAAPLQAVPMSEAELDPVDESRPPWPGQRQEVGAAWLNVRRTSADRDAGVVYVHGLGGSSTNWTDLAALLAPTADGAALDLPGFGFSEPTDGFDFTLAAHARVVADYLESLHRAPVHLVGNSMGGAIVLLVAAMRPDLVRSLTLISPAMPDRRPDPRRLSDPRLALAYLPLVGAPVRRQLAALGPRARAKQVIELCYADPSRFPEHRLDELAEEHSALAGQRWATEALARSTTDLFRAWLRFGPRSLWALARGINVPSLVIWGARDKVVSAGRAVPTATALRRARLLVLPDTGHVAQMERPELVARAMLGMWEHVRRDDW